MANLEVLALDEATPQIRAPGSGDGYTMPRPLAIGIGTITTDIKVLDLSVTWNNAAVAFSGIKLYVDAAARSVSSVFIDLIDSGTRRFSVRIDGRCDAPYGFYISGTHGGDGNWWSQNAFSIGSAQYALFGGDTILRRDASNTFAQRNSTTAQAFRLYRTYTDASNYQRLTKTWSTSTAVIHNEGAGTGADGSIAFNDAALATDATKGFIMIPSCAGTPTGTPADIPTGQVPIVFDSTNNKIYVYDGGWLATAALS